MPNRQLILFSGTSNFITAKTEASSYEDIILVNIEGWDSTPAIIRNTSSILWSNTTAVSKDATYEGQRVIIELHAMGTDSQLIILKKLLEEQLMDLNNLKTLQLFYYSDAGIELLRESLRVLPDSSALEWVQLNNSATITISFYAPNPLKQITRSTI